MARRRRHEEHDNHEAWAIPYGDLVTLLLAFFVVMYAMSSVNEGKYRVLSDSLSEAFHGTPHSPQPIAVGEARMQPIEQLPLTQVNRMITAALPAHRMMPLPVGQGTTRHGQTFAGSADPRGPADGSPAAVQAGDAASAAAVATPPPTTTATNGADDAALGQVAGDVSTAMGSLIAAGQVHVRRYENWVAVDISTDILFGSGIARLSNPAVAVLQRLADALKPWPNAIRVEGHTDDRPINTAAFPSNWELSAARAASVVHLFMDRGIAARRLAVMGFGQYRPTMANTSPAGRNANRRVAVVILGSDSAPEGRL